MKKIYKILIIVFISVNFVFANSFFNTPISQESITLLTIPKDYRNYFLMQSIDDDTRILIGDFSNSEKLFSLLIDKDSNGKMDKVIEYYPDSKDFTNPQKSTSTFFEGDFETMKRNIINGSIYKNNYSFRMKSFDTVVNLIKKGKNIYKSGRGYSIKFYDPDEPSTIMSQFFFSKHQGRYDLIFQTNYYKIYRIKIKPAFKYSVYCKNSKDAVVAEIVEKLLKMMNK